MRLWFEPITIEMLNHRGLNTMTDFLGIEFIEIGDDYLKARMPVTAKIKQPLGIVHGGANVVLAETLASVAANCVVDQARQYCVGLEINANHIRAVSENYVLGVTRLLHIGKSTQVWQVDIMNEQQQLTCVSRMTAAVLNR